MVDDIIFMTSQSGNSIPGMTTTGLSAPDIILSLNLPLMCSWVVEDNIKYKKEFNIFPYVVMRLHNVDMFYERILLLEYDVLKHSWKSFLMNDGAYEGFQ